MAPIYSAFFAAILLPCFVQASNSNHSLVVSEEPDFARPYVIPHLFGFTVQAEEYAVGFPVTNASTNYALSLITINGPPAKQIPVHYHAKYHETFFVTKGALQLFAQNESRRLGPLDMASVPVNQNHSFTILEPDTELVGAVAPGGFPFYQFIGTPFAPKNHAPYGPYAPINLTTIEYAIAHRDYYDYNPTDYTLNYDIVNGTTNRQLPWHTGNNTLPGSTVPYYIAGGWGPKYLHRELGQVISVYMSTAESNGRLTIATIAAQAHTKNETLREYSYEGVAQTLRVLEGQLFVEIDGQTAALLTGDTAVVPAGHKFKYWSIVAFTKIYSAAAVLPGQNATDGKQNLLGLVGDLVEDAELWNSAVFPAL